MNNSLVKCFKCNKEFNIRNGEGWKESYFKDKTMLPSSRYRCNDCIKKRKLVIKNGVETYVDE